MNKIVGPVTVALLIAACSGSAGASSSPGPTATPDLATSTPVATAGPTVATAVPMPTAEAPLFPGTYTTAFRPPLTLTVDREVLLNCNPNYACRGTVDAELPGWIDIEFGAANGSEIDIILLDKVYDPASPTKVIDPPADLAAWLKALPGTAKLGAPTSVTVGGKAAIQFDVTTPGDLQFGPMPGGGDGQAGIGPSGLRIVLVRVSGHLVLITEWLGPENTARDGKAALDSLQPLVQSITWL